jgi:N-acylglucosamine 2-epimerase
MCLRNAASTATWAYTHLVDATHGEWWGYTDRHGDVTHRFKGGAYKGCFHVPRALWLCQALLGDIAAHTGATADGATAGK